jgi:hypothetical protein
LSRTSRSTDERDWGGVAEDSIPGGRTISAQLRQRIEHPFYDEAAGEPAHDVPLGNPMQMGVVPVNAGIVICGNDDLVIELRAGLARTRMLSEIVASSLMGGETLRP